MNLVPNEKELRALVIKIIPAWNEDTLMGFNYLEGGFTNNNFVFERHYRKITKKYVLRSPVIAQPMQNRVNEFQLHLKITKMVSQDFHMSQK